MWVSVITLLDFALYEVVRWKAADRGFQTVRYTHRTRTHPYLGVVGRHSHRARRGDTNDELSRGHLEGGF